jgi:hypothetical protein
VNDIGAAVALIAKGCCAIANHSDYTNSPYLSKGWKIWRPPEFPLIYRAIPGEQFEHLPVEMK